LDWRDCCWRDRFIVPECHGSRSALDPAQLQSLPRVLFGIMRVSLKEIRECLSQ
jgi:hypothetical protein